MIKATVIPPKHYHGKIPEGYKKKDFIRFDVIKNEVYAITKDGERIKI